MVPIKKAEEFLKMTYDNSEYFSTHPYEKNYRLEHSYRVANIARNIAQEEGLDIEALSIAGLLHDISYEGTFKNKEDWKNHGRKSAQIVRPFLEELGFSPERIQAICYGIAIHVDDIADFDGEKTPFTISVGDADNIDHFDVYRIYENLQYEKFSELTLPDKINNVNDRLNHIEQLLKIEFGTKTAQKMWAEKLFYQKNFFQKLQFQLSQSQYI